MVIMKIMQFYYFLKIFTMTLDRPEMVKIKISDPKFIKNDSSWHLEL